MTHRRREAPHVMVVDGDATAQATLEAHLRRVAPDTLVTGVGTVAHARATLGDGPVHCIVTELALPDADGVDVVRTLGQAARGVPLVVTTARASADVAVECLKAGAADYVVKHDTSADRLVASVRDALGRAVLRSVDRPAVERGPSVRRFGGLDFVAVAERTQHVLALAERAAETRAPVLLEGETGTGKDLVARAIHARSDRRDAPFVVQHCAALSETLLESELFGHVRGAFTGADRDRAGLFREARNGTVFLDEIGDAPPSVQVKLLRVLQNGEVKAVGADRPERSGARIIAATNRVLADDVAAGRFRADLYFRLAVLPIEVPSLRDRIADLPALLQAFLVGFGTLEQRPPGPVSRDALDALVAYPWPGNVRELEHEAHRLVLTVAPRTPIRRHHLAARIRAAGTPWRGERLDDILERVELTVIRDRLAVCPSKAEAARSLGITREGLYGKLRRLGAMVDPW